MRQYLDFMRHVFEHGTEKTDRTGTGTRSVFGYQMRFDLEQGFPVLTTKKLHLRSIIHELLWFLQGSTNIAYLKEHGVSIWDDWADDNGELGPVYGKQWRRWETAVPGQEGGPPTIRTIDQISQLVDGLKNNPDSRLAIDALGRLGEGLIDQPADDLPVLEDEGHLVAPHLQHGARTLAVARRMSEAGVEEAGVMHAEFAHQRVERHHLGGMCRRHPHRLLGGEDVELVRVQHQRAALPDRLPVIKHRERPLAVDVDEARMALGAEADRPVLAQRREIDSPLSMLASPDEINPSLACSSRISSSVASEAPWRKRICDRREPSRTRIGKVRGEISA